MSCDEFTVARTQHLLILHSRVNVLPKFRCTPYILAIFIFCFNAAFWQFKSLHILAIFIFCFNATFWQFKTFWWQNTKEEQCGGAVDWVQNLQSTNSVVLFGCKKAAGHPKTQFSFYVHILCRLKFGNTWPLDLFVVFLLHKIGSFWPTPPTKTT